MPQEAAPLPDRKDLINAIEVLFPEEERKLVLNLLDEYQTGIWKESSERVKMAVLVLSEGSIEKLKEFVEEAKRDYRNVLYWSEYTKPGLALRADLEKRIRDRHK